MKDIYLGPVKLKTDQLSDPVNCSVAILTSDPGAIEAQLADVFSGPAQMSSSGPFVSADTVLDSRLDIPKDLAEPLLRLSPEHPVALVRHDTGEVMSRIPSDTVSILDLGTVPPFAAKRGADTGGTIPPGLEYAFLSGMTADTGRNESLYAVIDAAACPALPERLAASGLRFTSLFKGDAEVSLADVSPYLVEFSGHENFLRRLFTMRRGETDWINLYDLDACLFLRSAASFDDMRRHLRRYTKFRDDTGRWMFLRFWSPYFRAFLCSKEMTALPQGFLNPFSAVLCRLERDGWQIVVPNPERMVPANGFTQEFRWFCRTQIRLRFLARVRNHLHETYPEVPRQQRLALFYLRTIARGYRSERAVARYMEALWLNERHGWTEADLLASKAARSTLTLSDTHRAAELLKIVRNKMRQHV